MASVAAAYKRPGAMAIRAACSSKGAARVRRRAAQEAESEQKKRQERELCGGYAGRAQEVRVRKAPRRHGACRRTASEMREQKAAGSK